MIVWFLFILLIVGPPWLWMRMVISYFDLPRKPLVKLITFGLMAWCWAVLLWGPPEKTASPLSVTHTSGIGTR